MPIKPLQADILSQSYSVIEGTNNIRLTLAAEGASIGPDGHFRVAPGIPIATFYEGWLTGGTSFSTFTYSLYQDAQWSLLYPSNFVQVSSGTYLAGKGFNWGNSVSGSLTLTFGEPGNHRLLYVFGNRSFGHRNADAAIEVIIEVSRKIIPVRMDLVPHTFNPRNQGNFAVAFIELPSEYPTGDVDIPSLVMRTEAGSTPVIRPDKAVIEDHDGNGILDLKVEFDRGALIALSSPGEQTFILEGRLSDGTLIKGEIDRKVLAR